VDYYIKNLLTQNMVNEMITAIILPKHNINPNPSVVISIVVRIACRSRRYIVGIEWWLWQVYWHTPFPYIPHPIHRSLNDKYNDHDDGKDDADDGKDDDDDGKDDDGKDDIEDDNDNDDDSDDDDDDTWWWWQPWIVTIPWSTVTSIIDKDTEPVP